MRILHITPSYYPATHWGGPIFSLRTLVQGLARTPDAQVRVITTDTSGPAPRHPLPRGHMVFPPGYDVHFSRRMAGVSIAPGLLWQLGRGLAWADVVHLTGTYSFPTLPTLLATRLADKPLVWSPRGALQASYEWSGARRRRLKRAWELACRALAGTRCVLHATAPAEEAASRALLGPISTCVIPNGVDIPAQMPIRRYKPEGVLRLLYLGRLDPKKGIENLFQSLALLSEVPLTLKLCGTGAPAYVMSLRALARELRISHQLEFTGHVDAERKNAAFQMCDVCVLPSHSENFGMALAEALGHGLPVIASRSTPWEAVETRQCGLWRDNAPQSLAAAIARIADMDLQAMGIRGRAWVKCEFSADAVAARMLEVYRSFGERDARPAAA